jgi:hypothetical protein
LTSRHLCRSASILAQPRAQRAAEPVADVLLRVGGAGLAERVEQLEVAGAAYPAGGAAEVGGEGAGEGGGAAQQVRGAAGEAGGQLRARGLRAERVTVHNLAPPPPRLAGRSRLTRG